MLTSNKKKAVAAVGAVAVAAALALGGTFAWQSISQTALNEASDVVNPGGRLHDDFYIGDDGGYNVDVYVENFADDEIFARVKLQEYMEIVVNHGVEGAETVDTVAGKKLLDGTEVADKATDNASGYDYEYVTHYFGDFDLDGDGESDSNATDEYWDWTMGSPGSAEVWYMPTFNKNKDSLVADRNGMYVDRIGGISNRGQAQYEDWTVWADGGSKGGTGIYDADSDSVDEVKYDFENLQTYKDAGNIKTVEETHTAAPVGATNGLVSMAEWLQMLEGDGGEYDESAHGGYWVYDTDGWVYWSSPIPGRNEDGTTNATGLLLDSIELGQVMDDTWYYAINAVGQFVTAGDLGDGSEGNPGFYVEGEVPSEDAERLLEHIGALSKEPVKVTVSSPFEFTWTGYNGPWFYDAESGYALLSVEASDGGDYEWDWTVEGSDVGEGNDPSYVGEWDGHLALWVSPVEKSDSLTVVATAVGYPEITGSLTIPVKNTYGLGIFVDPDYYFYHDLNYGNNQYPVVVSGDGESGEVEAIASLEILNQLEVDPETKVVHVQEGQTAQIDGEAVGPGFYVDLADTEDASHVALKATLEDGRIVQMYVKIHYESPSIATNELAYLSPGRQFIVCVGDPGEPSTDENGADSYICDIEWNGVDSSKFTVTYGTHTDQWDDTKPAFYVTHDCDVGQCACVDAATEIIVRVTSAKTSRLSGEASVYVAAEMPSLEIGVLSLADYGEWDEYEWRGAAESDLEVDAGTELCFGVNDGWTYANWVLKDGEFVIAEDSDAPRFAHTFNDPGTYVLAASRDGWTDDTLTIEVIEASA